MNTTLSTGIKNARNVRSYMYGFGQLGELRNILNTCRDADSPVVYFIDHYFQANGLPARLEVDAAKDAIVFIDSTDEPKTGQVNALRDEVLRRAGRVPCAIVGIGGGTTLDIAKRLMDYGYHPPTIYFPLVVHGALMMEPTETESKEDLDQYIDALKKIAEEAKETPDVLRAAPTRCKVRRLDETAAARKPCLAG